MPKKVGTENWRKKRKQEHLEMKEFRYYIFCEGEQTEPNYFDGFKKLIENNPVYRDMVLIEIEPCGAETMRVIGMAERYVQKNHITKGQIWCVYDTLSRYGVEEELGDPGKSKLISSFFSTMSVEQLYRYEYKTLDELKAIVADYIDYFNNNRLHSSLLYKTPAEVWKEKRDYGRDGKKGMYGGVK